MRPNCSALQPRSYRPPAFRPTSPPNGQSALVWSNLRGVDSHGVLRIPRYIELLAKNAINSAPVMRVEKKAGAIAVLEADLAPGPVCDVAGDERSHRLRPRGPYRLVRSPQYHPCGRDRLFCSAGGGSRNGRDRHDGVRSDDGLPRRPRRRRIDQSDCDRISRRQQAGVPIDMSTATVAMGKVLNARDARRQVPIDWGIDADGRPTTDPKRISTLLPLGGPKGSGLSFMIECLCSLTVGNPIIAQALEFGRKPGQPVSQWRCNRDRPVGIR